MSGRGVYRIKRIAVFLLCLALGAAMLAVPGLAEDERETVRVGWYDSPFNQMDELGRRSGYAYEYQRKIAAYTGWKYEYVEGSWTELMDMLMEGKIDLMSDISFMQERTEYILYATLPMGMETYYIYISPNNTEITADSYASLNGKKVGVTKGSIQESLLTQWVTEHGIQPEIVELTSLENVSLQLLSTGELDAFLTLDAYDNPKNTKPIWKVGFSDFYFAVNKKRPDLLAELNAAMSRIQDENKSYNEELSQKYLKSTAPNLYLSLEEINWAKAHGTIRVGYQDNYMAFCAADEKGELTGALKDYLAYASTCLENADLTFEAIAYPTATAAMEALKSGEVDLMFPANLSDFESEQMGVYMSPVLMRTEMDAVVREGDQKEFLREEKVRVAVNEGNPNYEMFLADNYPGWEVARYKDTNRCLEAVAEGDADCIIISNYRFSNIAKLCEKMQLTSVYTGVDLDYCFAVREGDTFLYSILARVNGIIPEATVNAALTYYSTEDARVSFREYILENLSIVMTVVAVVALVIIVLMLRSIRAEKKANEEAHLVNDLNKKVYVDPLTSVRNKGAFSDYLDELQERVNNGDNPECAIGVFDCDDLKKINDQYGHDKGDIYLQSASRLICKVFQHSPVFRIGGDEFAVVLMKSDFYNREELINQFDKTRVEICAAVDNEWERVSVAMGLAVYDPKADSSLSDTLQRADKNMYARKRKQKEALAM